MYNFIYIIFQLLPDFQVHWKLLLQFQAEFQTFVYYQYFLKINQFTVAFLITTLSKYYFLKIFPFLRTEPLGKILSHESVKLPPQNSNKQYFTICKQFKHSHRHTHTQQLYAICFVIWYRVGQQQQQQHPHLEQHKPCARYIVRIAASPNKEHK